MRYRRFGATDLTVSEVGFGCARLGGFFGDITKADTLRTLHAACDRGVTFFDTADMYCQGESEKLLGEAFHGRREKVIIASKVGYRLPAQRQAAARIKPLLRPLIRRIGLKREQLPSGVRGTLAQDFSSPYIVKALEGSLKRLRTDYLDLYQLHSPPAAVLEDGEFIAALDKLKGQGKIRHYGVSCETTGDALLCLRYPGIAALQLRLSLLDQGALDEVIPHAAARGVAIIARECYAGGLLAKPIDDVKAEELGPDETTREMRRGDLAALQRVAERAVRQLSDVSLRFILDVDAVTVALLGMRTQAHLLDNMRRLESPPLAASDIQALRTRSTVVNH